MRFSGLFALVSNDDLTKGEVLFLSASRCSDSSIPEHLPYLKIRLEHVQTPTPDLYDPIDPNLGIWKLEDCHVLFPDLAGPLRGASVPQVTCPETEAEWRDARWIADMSTALGTKAIAHPDNVGSGNLNGTPVATRIPLAGGTVECVWPTFTKYRKKIQFDFPKATSRVSVTDLVQFDAGSVERFSIQRMPFDSSTRPPIVLKAPADASVPVYLWLQNLPNPEDRRMGVSGHFSRLYDFIDKRFSELKRHVPKNAKKCSGSPIGDSPVYCPPARLYYRS